ncbi:DMT family transporter [Veronia pacifica]|uniref:Transporter n=1 Tax=Veronia pacifica TaxID=1080227 RepID=A0A1C3EAJ7_9GAMM|nr:DMT family transporter [Veronia pacifica]ODA30230.1 transporter [Veronia pacifica]
MYKHLSIWCGVVVAVFFWSSNFNVIQTINGNISPLTSATLRFAIAALILLLIRVSKRSKSDVKLTKKSVLSLFLLATIGVTVQNFSIFSAMNFTSPVNAAVIQANIPLVTIILSGFILNTSISLRATLGAIVSFFGVVIVIAGGKIHSIFSNIGDLYMLSALVSGCLYTILAKRLTSDIPVSQQLRWILSIGTIQMAAVAMYQIDFRDNLNEITLIDLSLIAYMSLFGTLLAYYFWMKGAIVLGPEKISPLFNIMPVFTLLISLFSGQHVQFEHIFGVCIVAIGIYVGNSSPSNKSHQKALKT